MITSQSTGSAPVVSIGERLILVVLSLTMLSVSLYLSVHYYAVHFPKALSTGSLCDISGFWNCDIATLSPLASIGGVPTAVLGMLVATIFLVGALLPSEKLARTNYVVALVNALACLGLLSYSLTSLGSLCPGCTIYYLASFLVVALLIRNRRLSRSAWPLRPVLLVLASYGLLGGCMAAAFAYKTRTEEAKIGTLFNEFVEAFNKSPDLSGLSPTTPYRLVSASQHFGEAPLRLTVFSDFQCPVCKTFAEDMLPKLARHYHGKLNIEYVFYPMNATCNQYVSSNFHPLACRATYLSTCVGAEDFLALHDTIYAHQAALSQAWLDKLAQEYGVAACYRAKADDEQVASMVEAAHAIGVNATPTMLLNGRKLEGLLPLKFLVLLLDDQLARQAAKDAV